MRWAKAIAIDPNNPSIMYASDDGYSSSSQSLYKSVDAGASWFPFNNGLPKGADISSIHVSPKNSSILYVALMNANSSPHTPVYRSDDGGNSWRATSTGLNSSAVRQLAVKSTDPNVAYAAVYSSGVYKTTDGGRSWTTFNNGFPTPLYVTMNLASIVI